MIRRFLAGLALLVTLAAPAAAADRKPLVIGTSGRQQEIQSGDAVAAGVGGTGLTSLTAHCIIVGQGTSAAHLVCPSTSGLPLTSAGASSDPAFGAVGCNALPALTGDVTTTSGACATTIGTNKVTLTNVTQVGANTILGNATASTANVVEQSMPSCSTATSALKWTTSSGFGCNALGTFASQNYATPPAIGGTTPAAGSFSSLKDTGITGSTQCIHADTSGNLTGTGSDCGAGGGGGGGGWVYKTGNYTAVTGDLLVCTGASQTITLPASPATGAMVAIRVALLGTYSNAVNVSGNGANITGLLFTSQASIRLGLEGQEAWFIYDGTAWRASSPQGPVLLTPKVADFSWINQGTATATDTAEGLLMTDPNSGQPSHRILWAPVSGTFANLTVMVEKSGTPGNFTNDGPLVMNSSAAYLFSGTQQASTSFVIHFSSATAASSFPVNGTNTLGTPRWWQFKVVSTNITIGMSETPAAFTQVYSETLASFLTSITRVGIAVDGGAPGNVNTIFKHFHQE